MSLNIGDTVYFVDIDDTLFHQQDSKIKVKDWNGNIVETIDNSQYNTYKLKPGYYFDHSDFQSSDKFINNAQPIDCTVNKIKDLIKENRNLEYPNLILILTARGDFDDKNRILEFFEKEGIQVRRYNFIQFVRTGNISEKKFTNPQKKQAIVLSTLITNRFKNFVMIDDCIENLEAFYEVKQSAWIGKNVNFSFVHVIHDVIDGKHCNFRRVEVSDENARKYIDIYKAKSILAKYGINVSDEKVSEVDVAKDSVVEEIDTKIVESKQSECQAKVQKAMDNLSDAQKKDQ